MFDTVFPETLLQTTEICRMQNIVTWSHHDIMTQTLINVSKGHVFKLSLQGRYR